MNEKSVCRSRRRYHRFKLMILFLAGALLYFSQGRPASAKEVKPPTFSKESGFYEKDFKLKMKAPKGCKIYYSLDCSEPGENSLLYKNPIEIKDVTDTPNVHSARTDLQPYIKLNSSPYRMEISNGWYARNILPDNVDKCQVVRAVAVDKKGNRSQITTASYFIGYQAREGYDKMAVLSLVADPADLFDQDKGIMVNGREYIEAWLSGILDDIKDTHKLRKYCNTFKGKGRDWERKIHMDFFSEKKHDLAFAQEAGIRLHGNQSRVTQPHKSFNLYARKEYGSKTFLEPLYDDGLLQNRVTLMRGDDVRNYFLSETMNNRTMKTQKYRLAQVFLDGEYWGIYAIQEKYHSKEYMKSRYNLDKEDYILVKGTPSGFVTKNGDPEAIKTSFKQLRVYARNHDLSDEVNYRKLSQAMDMQSFIDSYAARLYICDQDWNWIKNQVLLYSDNKWHWICFDMDYGASWYNPARPDTDSFTHTRLVPKYSLDNDPLFSNLMANADFRRQFVTTFMDLGNEVFEGKKMRKETDDLRKTYREAGILESSRYPTNNSIESSSDPAYISEFNHQLDRMGEFFELRFPYAADYAADYFGLTGSQAAVTLVNNTPEGGSIKVNTITPSLNKKGSWTGTYYTDYPVTLTAQPKRGWEFAGWKLEKGEEGKATGLKKKPVPAPDQQDTTTAANAQQNNTGAAADQQDTTEAADDQQDTTEAADDQQDTTEVADDQQESTETADSQDHDGEDKNQKTKKQNDKKTAKKKNKTELTTIDDLTAELTFNGDVKVTAVFRENKEED